MLSHTTTSPLEPTAIVVCAGSVNLTYTLANLVKFALPTVKVLLDDWLIHSLQVFTKLSTVNKCPQDVPEPICKLFPIFVRVKFVRFVQP